MKKLKIFSVCWVALVFLMGVFFAPPAQTQVPCDCNGDGQFNITDLIWFDNYLYDGLDPPVNPIDCDVDGTAGINVGDLWQCEGILFEETNPIPYTGIPASFSNIEFTFPVITSGGIEPFNVTLDLTENPGPDLMGMVITFSYGHEPDHVGVHLHNVDFEGSIVPEEWQTSFYIGNRRKALLWLRALSPDDPPLEAGEIGLIATLTFSRVENPGGLSTVLSPTVFPPTHSPMLITDYYANGTAPADRVLIPRYVLRRNGDVNLDGRVDIADVVYLINFLFLNGPPPCVW